MKHRAARRASDGICTDVLCTHHLHRDTTSRLRVLRGCGLLFDSLIQSTVQTGQTSNPQQHLRGAGIAWGDTSGPRPVERLAVSRTWCAGVTRAQATVRGWRSLGEVGVTFLGGDFMAPFLHLLKSGATALLHGDVRSLRRAVAGTRPASSFCV